MKIAVITRHGITNYGSLLQTMATQQVIENMGHSSEIIDYIRQDETYYTYEKTILKRKPDWNNNLLKRMVYLGLRQPGSVLAGKKFEAARKKYLKLSRRYSSKEELKKMKPEADIFMTGSDQVWGPVANGGYDPSYCLSFTDENDIRIAYAASFGHTEMTDKLSAYYQKWLSRYDSIAVREDSAVKLVQNLDLDACQVIDPTLLLDAEYWSQYLKPIRNGKYILIYQLHNDKKLDRYAKKVAREKKLPLIRISVSFQQIFRQGRFKWAPELGAFLSYIKNAECMITDSFHGAAFAINFNTPFVQILPNNNTGTRNMSILKLTGLTDRILMDEENTSLASQPVDFSKANAILSEERKRSLAVLNEMIQKGAEKKKKQMSTVCDKDQCTGCMLCMSVCQHDALTMQDNLHAYNVLIDPDRCSRCNACHHICPVLNPVEKRVPKYWYQGWMKDEDLRSKSSSGGAAAAIGAAFIKKGGLVYSCTFRNGQFLFESADTLEDLKKFSGSKYVKSNPGNIYKEIRTRLQSGREVLFIGLPCQVAALKQYVGSRWEDQLYTCDLICHGTPSPKLLESYLKQYGIELDDVKEIQFRKKARFQLFCDGQSVIRRGVTDRYLISFLNTLIYTENCYNCSYASTERISDITIGDSWGSSLTEAEKAKGISLILCQTEKGRNLVEEAEMVLTAVDIETSIANNGQLSHPSPMPKARADFFEGISKKKPFNQLVEKACKKQCMRQDIKNLLIKCRLITRE